MVQRKPFQTFVTPLSEPYSHGCKNPKPVRRALEVRAKKKKKFLRQLARLASSPKIDSYERYASAWFQFSILLSAPQTSSRPSRFFQWKSITNHGGTGVAIEWRC